MILLTRWSLDEALSLIRALQQPIRKFGYHLCLGGGVLNNGESEKDLDLYFLPMGQKDGSKSRGLLEYLCRLWGKPQNFDRRPKTREDEDGTPIVTLGDDGKPEYDEVLEAKHFAFMGKFNYNGLRIDVFVYGGDNVTVESLYTEEDRERLREIEQLGSIFSDPPTLARAPRSILRDIERSATPAWRSAPPAQPFPPRWRPARIAPPEPGSGYMLMREESETDGIVSIWQRSNGLNAEFWRSFEPFADPQPTVQFNDVPVTTNEAMPPTTVWFTSGTTVNDIMDGR